MSEKRDVRIINPLVLATAAAFIARKADAEGCGEYADSPVCTDGNTDVSCSLEIYRGCQPGQNDCADSPNGGNQDDKCCAGITGGGDNIDHQYCFERDGQWGDISWCFFGGDMNWPSDWFHVAE